MDADDEMVFGAIYQLSDRREGVIVSARQVAEDLLTMTEQQVRTRFSNLEDFGYVSDGAAGAALIAAGIIEAEVIFGC